MKTCKIEGCEAPRVRGAYLCNEHIGEKRRCDAQVVLRDEKDEPLLDEQGNVRTRQCKRSARPGTTLCATHSGERGKAVAQRTQALTEMQKFATPYNGQIDPLSAFENEYRRTYGHIRWYEEKIGQLQSEKDLIWGLAKEEHVNATEFAGINRTYEARIHPFAEELFKERKHLVELTKIWLKAGLEERKIAVMREYMEYTYAMVNEAARALGHDPADPEVRERIMRLFTADGPAARLRPNSVG